MPKETILVVDDERLVRWSLQQKLEQWGYHVSLAEDGATALGRIQLDNPDLVTLDVRLPDMTGIEVLSELRNRNIQIPVIVITAFGVVDDAVRSLKLGAYDFIEKPINFEKLENAVRNALGNPPPPHRSCANSGNPAQRIQCGSHYRRLRTHSRCPGAD